ncbi:MAG: hypothetical protein MSA93_10265, partial [Spirochaetales bacterium]|nr:hypothetical protein [Spirochaetales bacterium]
MKKTILILTSIFLVISLFVSCNDGEEGLFQMAANSVKKESFKILGIINRESDNTYIVATDNGIAKYDTSAKAFSEFNGTGVTAKDSVWASADGSEYIYFDSSSDSYKDKSGEKVEIVGLDGLTPQPFYSVNGNEFTYVFKNRDNEYFAYYTPSSLTKEQFLAITPTSVTIADKVVDSVSIIGNGILRVICKDKSYYLYDSETGNYITTESIINGIADDGLCITNEGKMYYFDGSTILKIDVPDSSPISRKYAIFSTNYEGNKYSYFIPEGSSSVIELKGEGVNV